MKMENYPQWMSCQTVSYTHLLPDTLRKVKYFGNKFDRISVREDMGVKICKEILQLNARRVLDLSLIHIWCLCKF